MNNIPQNYQDKPLVASWTYYSMNGTPVGVVGRYQDGCGKKEFVPFFKRNGTTWGAGIELDTRPLYGLDKLVNHPKENAVFIVEGEKVANALQGIGICAISSLGGSSAAHKTDWTPLCGYQHVFLLPDNDKPGEDYMHAVYQELLGLNAPPTINVIRLPGLPIKGDAVDWMQQFLTEWDGYASIDTAFHEALKKKLRVEINNAELIPKNWSLASLAVAERGDFDWQKPNEIETKTPSVQALSLELIPEPFRPWLMDVSHRMQMPPDFSTVTALVITGSIIGSGCGMRPKCFDDWEVISNLWGACIGEPTVVLKSPSMKEPIQLVNQLQGEYDDQFKLKAADVAFDILVNNAKLDDVKSKIKQATKAKDEATNPDDLHKLKADYMDLIKNAESEPTCRLFKTNEISIQSMTLLQRQNPRGILFFRDELTGLLVKWDRDDGADERAYFLEGWNGDGSYSDFKIGRGLTHAKNISISLSGGIQPDKLRRYLFQAMNGANDGLMQRLQLAVWPDEPKSWQLIDTKPNEVDKQRAYSIIQTLAEIDFIAHGAQQGVNDARPYFRFSEAGQKVFNDWLTELQTVKIQQSEYPLLMGHLGKFRSLMPSLALIFHLIEIADGKASGAVSERAARLAVQWCDYLESHARRIYAMVVSPEHEAAVMLAKKIKANALPNPFTSKIVYDKGWHSLKDREEVDAACNILMDEGWLMMTRKPKLATGGRPPLPAYHINPSCLSKSA
ncbi:MAG: DUF3987 domain-containing protein [Methylobacter sp.]|nr:DUF3987 domain-containing protein [Candidatus Methylobacter titanis]